MSVRPGPAGSGAQTPRPGHCASRGARAHAAACEPPLPGGPRSRAWTARSPPRASADVQAPGTRVTVGAGGGAGGSGVTDGRAMANGRRGRQSCGLRGAHPPRPLRPRLGGQKQSGKNCSKTRQNTCAKETEATQGTPGDTSGKFSWFLWSSLGNTIVSIYFIYSQVIQTRL